VADAAGDAHAIFVEKHGECPPMEATGAASLVCVPGHVRFVLLEVLKNALGAGVQVCGCNFAAEVVCRPCLMPRRPGATLARHKDGPGPLPPVRVAVGASAAGLGVLVVDPGPGMPPSQAALAPQFFYTTVPEEEPTYTFSGNFGGQIEGQGLGLSLATAYVRAAGGSLALNSVPGVGTAVAINYPAELLTPPAQAE
jgi:signal transduction histidine kinase